MGKLIKRLGLACLVLSVSSTAYGAIGQGTITTVRPDELRDGVIITIEGTLTGTLTCTIPSSTNITFFLDKDPQQNVDWELFDEIFAVALAAQIAGRSVYLRGDDTCGNYNNDTERVRNIRITD